MMTKTRRIVGTWRIVHMDDWDDDYLNLEAPAFIAFEDAGQGSFLFGTVSGTIRYGCDEDEDEEGAERVEFTWDGENDSDPACGSGWASVTANGTLSGYFGLDSDDEFAFVAQVMPSGRA